MDNSHFLFAFVEALFDETEGKIWQLPKDSDAEAENFVKLQTSAETRIGFHERPIQASRYFPPLRAGVFAGDLAGIAMDDDDDEDNEQGEEDEELLNTATGTSAAAVETIVRPLRR